ncbi:MAG: CRISPR-associated helicase Cas3' [Nitrospirota bacterium]|nr:CRISPR-associated helicase Cas3' [Nitrospirota bacterium]
MTEVNPIQFVARYKQADASPQSVMEHLEGTAKLASDFARKIGLPMIGELTGLLHDFGKYSNAFQAYIKSAQGTMEPDDEDYVETREMRCKIDHSTAGAQYLLSNEWDSDFMKIAAEMMALCIASHHSGLIDCLAPDGTDVFTKRIRKSREKTHYAETLNNVESHISNRVRGLLGSAATESEFQHRIEQLREGISSVGVGQFMLGFMARFLFSALIDADRTNSAGRDASVKPDWTLLVDILEANLDGFVSRNKIDEIREKISSSCLQCADREKGLYQITVPTGGGKTLASLRFALHHAAKYDMDRIIYVLPYTSIIDQNARVARALFAFLELTGKQIVLEHHSNLTPEQDTPESKLLAENWDAPIIFTTAVQFLETLFASGTRGVRRLHQLANSVVIFDEIQTIPIRTVHLFNNAVNFLVSQCGSTVVFCSATQPLLHKVDAKKGAATLSDNPEMMPNVDELFRDLHRAKIEDRCRASGWSVTEIAETAAKELVESGSILVIVNKKSQARELYQLLHGKTKHVYHLSTSMCPAHRTTVLDKIKTCLDPRNPSPVICISTQLIEAGVDIDFGSVIRYLAGLDSVAQAAGRCNRNGRRKAGRVFIVNQQNEDLSKLPDIMEAKKAAERVLREYHENPAVFDHDLQSPKVMERYYLYYFFNRVHEMAFPVSDNDIANMTRNDDLLTLLSTNKESVQIYINEQRKAPPLHLRQSFMSAAKAFKVIDSPTQGVIVPYGDGERIIAELVGGSNEKRALLMKQAQRYSVNLFPHEMMKLKDRLYEVWEGSKVYYLDERHYSEQFGASTDQTSEMKTLII